MHKTANYTLVYGGISHKKLQISGKRRHYTAWSCVCV